MNNETLVGLVTVLSSRTGIAPVAQLVGCMMRLGMTLAQAHDELLQAGRSELVELRLDSGLVGRLPASELAYCPTTKHGKVTGCRVW